MPLAQRLPELGGFKNPFKKVYAVVNLTKLNRFEDGATVEPVQFYEAGLAREGLPVKLLGTGKLRRKLTITAHAASDSARSAIEAKGGGLTLIGYGGNGGTSAPTLPSPARGEGTTSAPAASGEGDDEESPEA
jgi:ribosomal protein L15